MDYEEINAVRILDKKIARETRRLEDLHFLALPSGPKLDGMPRASATTSKTESIATLIVECEKTIVALYEQLEHEKFLLLTKLQAIHMNELAQRVLSYHYVACQSFNAIAKIMNYSRSYILKLHEEGLKTLGLNLREMLAFKKAAALSPHCASSDT